MKAKQELTVDSVRVASKVSQNAESSSEATNKTEPFTWKDNDLYDVSSYSSLTSTWVNDLSS